MYVQSMSARDWAYELVMQGARPLLRVVAPVNAKLERGATGQRLALDSLRRWNQRQPDTPLIWVHAPSVGESLMAQAVVHALKARLPGLQVAFTHFSPSAERVRERVGADVSGYLPWDTGAEMRDALQILRPSAVVFVRSEIWPTLVRLSAASGIPALLVNAVLAEGSSRLRPLARFALGPGYQRLAAVGAIDAAAATRFERLGVQSDRIRVTGDARFDQVWQRVQALDRGSALLARLRDPAAVTVVAGSTWPTDEVRLLPAFARLTTPSARLILAAHEPTESHLRAQEEQLTRLGMTHGRLARIEMDRAALPRVVIVDRVGVLADLYAIADIAYIGGAFQGSGVHSVVEPAALGVPVLMGPDHANASEARELIAAGGAHAVRDAESLYRALDGLTAVTARSKAGAAARAFVEQRLGAAAANADLILSQLVRD
jgi:3-deoxy-D-manno-octulosonic-acid transferase